MGECPDEQRPIQHEQRGQRVEHQDYTGEELRDLLLGTLFGALGSAGAADLLQ